MMHQHHGHPTRRIEECAHREAAERIIDFVELERCRHARVIAAYGGHARNGSVGLNG